MQSFVCKVFTAFRRQQKIFWKFCVICFDFLVSGIPKSGQSVDQAHGRVPCCFKKGTCTRRGLRKQEGRRHEPAPFWEPDTRQQPLPLLPFGPGGVGGATAARFPMCESIIV